jgi:aminoglycoside 6'-N-acetyltransferase I
VIAGRADDPRGFMVVRLFRSEDLPEWRRMRDALWPDQTAGDVAAWLARPDTAVLVAERTAGGGGSGGGLCGFAEVGARSIAEGCTTSPVAYLEGWYVDPDARRRGVGTTLLHAVEDWARRAGYRELASDTELTNQVSQQVHERLGFTEVERAVQYRKAL